MGFCKHIGWVVLLILFAGIIQAQDKGEHLDAINCEGLYVNHLQGITSDDGKYLFWSFTDTLVKTDMEGKILEKIPVDNHHGDLIYRAGKIYVAVNLGKFNQPAGQADSWVYVYKARNLKEIDRYPVPEVVHGAGGMAVKDKLFYVVGGLPGNVNENYIYSYDKKFKFKERSIIASGHTHLGIQTVDYMNDSWYFGCYGTPSVLIKTDKNFSILGQWDFDAALGLTQLKDGRILVARGYVRDGRNGGQALWAREVADDGLQIINNP